MRYACGCCVLSERIIPIGWSLRQNAFVALFKENATNCIEHQIDEQRKKLEESNGMKTVPHCSAIGKCRTLKLVAHGKWFNALLGWLWTADAGAAFFRYQTIGRQPIHRSGTSTLPLSNCKKYAAFLCKLCSFFFSFRRKVRILVTRYCYYVLCNEYELYRSSNVTTKTDI